jgi:alcohol dehydrogenase
MKAAIVPSANSRWEIQEVPTPEPGPGQVLIKIHASGLCYTDVHQTRGELPGPFPRTLGHEPVGEIVALGVGVNTRRVRDRVGVPWIQTTCGRCEWCLRGRPMFCPEQIGTGAQMSGGHAEYIPIGTIRPVCSARRTKCRGLICPYSGLNQRSRASAPTMRPDRISISG